MKSCNCALSVLIIRVVAGCGCSCLPFCMKKTPLLDAMRVWHTAQVLCASSVLCVVFVQDTFSDPDRLRGTPVFAGITTKHFEPSSSTAEHVKAPGQRLITFHPSVIPSILNKILFRTGSFLFFWLFLPFFFAPSFASSEGSVSLEDISPSLLSTFEFLFLSIAMRCFCAIAAARVWFLSPPVFQKLYFISK